MAATLTIDIEEDFPPYLNTNKGVEGIKKIKELAGSKKLTAFVCADFLAENPQILDYAKGWEFGCHGLRHVDYAKLPHDKVKSELEKSLEIFSEYGIKPKGFRAPYASVNETVLSVVAGLFEYDSSLGFFSRAKPPEGLKELPIFLGGKALGINPALFSVLMKMPVKNKVFFVHPWEVAGVEFSEIEKRRRIMKPFGYSRENYIINIKKVLNDFKPLSELMQK
ncbi:MAG: hypothetical protein MSIBF_05895 [Candidatus Altiarchaeales archaeon IMC4]|nr:MAG: hypothetical protein MSIBF_05895 [Candidatus Altiarchaeales archaeon IMC4]